MELGHRDHAQCVYTAGECVCVFDRYAYELDSSSHALRTRSVGGNVDYMAIRTKRLRIGVTVNWMSG